MRAISRRRASSQAASFASSRRLLSLVRLLHRMSADRSVVAITPRELCFGDDRRLRKPRSTVTIRCLRALVVAGLVGGCSADTSIPPPPGASLQSSKARDTDPGVSPPERAQFQRDRTELALGLYRAAAASSTGNVFFSPHSI